MNSILALFALLLSNRWVSQWQKQWARQQSLLARPAEPSSGKSQQRNKARRRTSQKQHQQKSLGRGFYERIFTLRVTLWYLLFQRLSFDQSLSGVVRDVRAGGADRLGSRRRKLSRRVRSTATSAYNQARQRLPLELLCAALSEVGQKMVELVGWSQGTRQKPAPHQRVRQLLDGSTLAMLHTRKLAQAYPAAHVRSGVSDWCLMRIVVGFCARGGAVLSAAEGPTKKSEQRLAWGLMEKAARFVIWIADRNFGVWSVVAQAVRFEQDALVRLTGARAAKLAAGRPLRSGEDRPVRWVPSRHDQAAPGAERTAISGRLIYVRLKRGHRWIHLWLFTTLEAQSCPVQLLVRWYGQRWQAELHFRSVKTQLGLSQLDVRTPEMARKEFYAALLAYNLVRAVLWGAGECLEAGVQTLSFNNARRVVLDWLNDWGRSVGRGAGRKQRWVKTLLEEVQQQKLPRRKKPRPNQPRMVRSHATKWPTLKGSRAKMQKRHAKSL